MLSRIKESLKHRKQNEIFIQPGDISEPREAQKCDTQGEEMEQSQPEGPGNDVFSEM